MAQHKIPSHKFGQFVFFAPKNSHLSKTAFFHAFFLPLCLFKGLDSIVYERL